MSGVELDVAPDGPLPWPADAVMIVAANAGEERRENMEGVVACSCRRCGQALNADTKTVRFADQMPERRGRPVKFFCVPCAVLHNRSQIQKLVDHR